MLETIQDLKTRRSCRGYKEEQISEEQLNQILEAGTYAPTGMGMQSPIMVVVQDKETIAQLFPDERKDHGNRWRSVLRSAYRSDRACG